jgi:hypothetical protein
MRISNNFLIGIFIIVLLALNLYVIPQQKKVQLELDNKAVWEVAVTIDYDRIITPYSLIELIDSEPVFQLKSIDKNTGKSIKFKDFPDEIGAAHKVAYLEDAIYVIFALSSIYKLDPKTLEILWKIDCNLSIYNWESMSIEQSKDLILIYYNTYYKDFYVFLEKETGALFYETRNSRNSKIIRSISAIFHPKKEGNWGRYYNFKNNKFVFDTISKDIQFTDKEYLANISDSLNLTSFVYGSKSFQKTHQRSHTGMPFNTRKKALFLENEIAGFLKKEITNIQVKTQSILFHFENKEKNASSDNTNLTDYVFFKKGAPHVNLSLQNIATSPQPYASDDYFVGLDANNQPQSHQKVLLINLNDLSIKQSFYIPLGQDLLKLFCDEKQIYALVRKADRKTYWLAVPITL